MNQEMAINKHPQEKDLEEEELLLLQETASLNTSSSFFNEPAAAADRFPHLHNTCTSCGSHKRPSSENPVTHLNEPNPKKPNNNATHPLFGFSKIPLSPPPFLRRCSSDPCKPVEELEPPGTPLSNAIASNKLPPRPPTLKRCGSDLMPSPVKTISSSSDSPHAEWLRKMGSCMREMSRKWDELLCDEGDVANGEMNINNGSSHGANKESNDDAALENYDGGYVEAVSVEKKGEALILHFKCPCGAGYQIIFFGGNCYYKLL